MTATDPVIRPGPGAMRRPSRPRGFVPLLVVVVVLLLCEGAVRAGRSGLAEPVLWPTPELQAKYRQIGAQSHTGRGPDVVLVGDSMMDAGGDPAGLAVALPGVQFYNASIAGETLPVIAQWTTRIVVPKLRPKVVVIGFSSNELHPLALAPGSGVEAYRSSRVVRAAEGRGGVIDRADELGRRHSVLYRYRSSLRRPFLERGAEPDVFDPELTAEGHDLAFARFGYLQTGGPAQAQAVAQGVTATLAGYSVGIENVTVLQEMIRSIRRRGASVVLVAMPVTEALIGYHPQGGADYAAAMEAFAGAAERSGATFVQPGVWPEDVFADPVHLNAAGSAQLSAYLGPLIAREVAAPHLVQP